MINPYAYSVSGGTDPYFSSVISLAHFDGTNGDTGPFADQIAARSPGWTRIATGPQLSTSQKKYGTAALDNQSVGIYNADHADWDFGSGDFTLEFWVYFNSLTDPGDGYTVLSFKGTTGGFGPWIVLKVAGAIYFRMSTSGSSWVYNVNGNVLSATTWHHIAMCRSGTSAYGFCDGVQVGSTGSVSGALVSNSAAVTFGSYGTGAGANTTQLNGYFDDMRVTKGVARYTSNFTPPTAAFPNS